MWVTVSHFLSLASHSSSTLRTQVGIFETLIFLHWVLNPNLPFAYFFFGNWLRLLTYINWHTQIVIRKPSNTEMGFYRGDVILVKGAKRSILFCNLCLFLSPLISECLQASLVTRMLKNLPTMQEIQVWSLDWEDPLEKEMATPTPIFLPGRSFGQRSLVGYNPQGCKELDTTEQLTLFTCLPGWVGFSLAGCRSLSFASMVAFLKESSMG